MKRTLLLLVLCFFLAGCSMVYTHSTKTGEDFEKDRQECQMYAKNELAAKGICET